MPAFLYSFSIFNCIFNDFVIISTIFKNFLHITSKNTLLLIKSISILTSNSSICIIYPKNSNGFLLFVNINLLNTTVFSGRCFNKSCLCNSSNISIVICFYWTKNFYKRGISMFSVYCNIINTVANKFKLCLIYIYFTTIWKYYADLFHFYSPFFLFRLFLIFYIYYSLILKKNQILF